MANTSYRSESEYPILLLTLALIGVVFLLTASVTACIAPLLLILTLAAAYQANAASRSALLRQALRVSLDDSTGASPTNQPFFRLSRAARQCRTRLNPGPVEIFIVRGRERNAYTFGLSNPKSVVVYASLLEIMDEEELKFVIGHEMGHVALGHTWLNTLVGGLAGVPQPAGLAVILSFAFMWWNRACEYSADRAGLLACGNPGKAITALAKLVVGDIHSQAEFQRAMVLIDAQDDNWGNLLGETLSTHPMIIKRIQALRKFSESSTYRKISMIKS